MDELTRVRRSKSLSMWLRHKPERGGLILSPEGWAALPAILEAFERQGDPLDIEELRSVIRLDPKGRFETEGDRVRARYGHSLELEEKPHPGKPPAALFHGTTKRFVPKILEGGLKPMKRQYVHLSPDKKTAREVGRRRDQDPAILQIDAHRAFEEGILFYPRGKGVWISDPIPPQYLSIIEDSPQQAKSAATRAMPDRGARPISARQAAPGEPRRRRPKGGFTKKTR